MKVTAFLSLFVTLIIIFPCIGQSDYPELKLQVKETESHLRYLSSDGLMGRRTGEAGNHTAANYIAQFFKTHGVQTIEGVQNYYQPVGFEASQPPQKGILSLGKKVYRQDDDLLILSGNPISLKKAKAIFAGQGWVDEEKGHNDYKGLDVKGKIVIVLPGTPNGDDPLTIFQSMAEKRKFAAENGAIALFEIYRLTNFPWQFFKNYFGKETLRLAKETVDPGIDLTYGWIYEGSKAEIVQLATKKALKVDLTNSGAKQRQVQSQNVIGLIPGTDPKLKDEYILLTAHYDHVGTGKNGGGAYTQEDSIFNGARDNAMGTTALLSAAKAFSKSPPKRPVIIMALTGEELGLLGSSYYADHPVIDLKKTIFNLNTDGAGYNDTNYISIIGMGRTGTDQQITTGVETFGLKVFPDPVPEQGLYDRGDNVSFAKKGIPAINFSPGLTAFTPGIMKYYHQVADEADSIDFAYLLKYCQAFVHTARKIADMDGKPQWVAGDKYEAAGLKLYSK